jgi:SAM-dependent methyltransferase
MEQYLLGAPQSQIILNIGSGTAKVFAQHNLVNLDVFPYFNTDVGGDAHYLPFLSESFDGAFICAVLEHLANPFQATEEIWRVLTPGGFVLAAAPFVFPIHADPDDYFRFTENGLRQLFREFEEMECGWSGLPTRGLLELLKVYFSSFSDNWYLSHALRWGSAWLLSPLKFLDHYLQHRHKSYLVCSSFYYLGRKPRREG